MDYHGQNYVKSLTSINKELKRLTDERRRLMIEKKKMEKALYEHMGRKGINQYQGYKREKLQPKEKETLIRKKKKEKERDAIRLFYEIGIPDPESFYKEFQMTQKA